MNRYTVLCAGVLVAACGCKRPLPTDSTAPTTARARPVAEEPPLPLVKVPPDPRPPGTGAPDAKEPDAPYTFRKIQLPKGVGGPIVFSTDSRYMAVGGASEICVLTVPDGREVIRMQLPDNKSRLTLAFAEDGKHLISASPSVSFTVRDPAGPAPPLATDKIRFWSLATGKQTKELDLPRTESVYWVVGFAPSGKLLALKTAAGSIIADPQTGKVVAELEGAGPNAYTYGSHGGAFSPDGKLFAAGAGKNRLGVWAAATGKLLATSDANRTDFDGEFTYVAFSPDGRWIGTGAASLSEHPTRIWDAATAARLCELPFKTSTGHFVWMPDGTAIARVQGNPIPAVDVATGKTVHEFRTNAWLGRVDGATPDGRYLAFGTDGAVHLCRLPAPKRAEVPKAELTATELDSLWADAATENKIRQDQIRATFAAAPGSAVSYLAKKVPVPTAEDVALVHKLIAELGAESPDVRKKAQERLVAVGHRFKTVLDDALTTAPAGEINNRLTFLRHEIGEKPIPADLRAEFRGIELLAQLNTAAAIKHLDALAAGAPQSRVTKEAKTVLGKRKP